MLLPSPKLMALTLTERKEDIVEKEPLDMIVSSYSSFPDLRQVQIKKYSLSVSSNVSDMILSRRFWSINFN